MTKDEKAEAYDALVRKCEDRLPRALGVLGSGSTSGFRHAPVEAVLAAFDKLTPRR